MPAINQPPTDVVGKRHYCFEHRKPTRPATLTFDDVTGWSVAQYGNAKGEMVRTREAQIWSKYVAKVSIRLERYTDRVELRPPKPIPLPDGFDCVNIWVRTDKWYVYAKPPVALRLSLRISDASGEKHVVRMGTFPWKDWFLAHRRVIRLPHATPATVATGGDGNGHIDMPAALEAIIVDGCTGGRTATLYLDYVSFYREELKPLMFAPPPAPPIFPTTPNTILPTCHAKHEVRMTGDARGATFSYRGTDGRLVYEITPHPPGFSGVTAQWNDGTTFRPLAGGGPELAGAKRGETLCVHNPRVRWKTLGARMQDDVYRVRWRMSTDDRIAHGTTAYQLNGKSLVITIRARGGQVAAVRFGRCEGLARPKLVRVPFLALRPRDPYVLCAQGLFVSAFIDWYVSDASALDGGGAVWSRTSAQFNGGCRYLPKTDGRRNDVRERIFLTVSPRFDEVLPNIPNPPNPHSKMMASRAWWDVGRANMDQIERMYRWGLRSVMMEYNGVIWKRGTDFIRRVFYADGGINVGAEKMIAFSKKIRSMGYLFGLHTDFCIIPPGVFRCWDEDWVTRTSDGDWLPLWGRCYAVKVSRAEEIQRKYSRINKEVFGTCCGYSDVVTSIEPGRNTDYDARVPLAGKFRGQFEAYGRMLRSECEVAQGPVISEGRHQWFYAGLPAGNYGQMGGPDAFKRNMLLDFDLLKIHPLECDVGIGIPSMFYGAKRRPTYRRAGVHSDWFDRWVAWTLACGHIAQLTGDWGNAGLLKSFYIVQPAQQHYARVPVKRIRYFDGERLVSTSQAIQSAAVERNQICVEYTNGLIVYVNGSWADDWMATATGRTWLLPPAGFLLQRPGKLLEYSALVGSRRVDCVQTSDVCYLDGRGQWTNTEVLATDGAAACFRDEKNPEVLWVVPAMRANVIAFRPAHFGLGFGPYRVTAYGFASALRDVPYQEMGEKIAIEPTKDVVAYRVIAGQGLTPTVAAPMRSEPAIDFAISPRQWLNVTRDQPIEAKVVVWVRDDVEGPVRVALIDRRGRTTAVALQGKEIHAAPITFSCPRSAGESFRVIASCGSAKIERRFHLTASETTDVVKDLMAPDVHDVWGYCRRGGKEQFSSVPRGPGYTRFQRSSGICGGKKRPAFAAPPVFDKPPHGYVFGKLPVELPQEETDLAFGIGINETATSADGVTFSVILTDERGRRHALFRAHQGNGPWRDVRISLAEFAGQWVALRFQTDCGPKDNADADSARWAEPRIVFHKPRCHVAMHED